MALIVSDEHRYVFIELPRTGSTAIRKELVSQYDGTMVLHKHSTYPDFLRIATDDQRTYFAFSGIRNPLDDAVSHYFKLKTDHHGRFSDPERRKYRLGNRGAATFRASGTDRRGEKPSRRRLTEVADNFRHDFIRRRDADFAAFFKWYRWLPYDNWSRLSHGDLDHVVRFEHLQEDFASALEHIGLEQTRPLPVTNRTGEKSADFLEHYTPEIVGRARYVYGPYMQKWGYQMPPEWGDRPLPRWNVWLFEVIGVARTLYWRMMRRAG